MTLHPEEWAAIYESPHAVASGFVFRHGAEVARQACLARARRGERWADVGCGPGFLAVELAAAGLDVVGVDNDPAMLEAAEQRFSAERERGVLRFRLGDAARLPLEDAMLDGVVATSLVGCLEHATPFFREIERVLRSGGIAVLTFTNRSSLLHALGRLRRRHSSLYTPARSYSHSEAATTLERAGLAVSELHYYNCFLSLNGGMLPPLRLALALERLLDNRAGSLVARNMLAVAAKRGSPAARR